MCQNHEKQAKNLLTLSLLQTSEIFLLCFSPTIECRKRPVYPPVSECAKIGFTINGENKAIQTTEGGRQHKSILYCHILKGNIQQIHCFYPHCVYYKQERVNTTTNNIHEDSIIQGGVIKHFLRFSKTGTLICCLSSKSPSLAAPVTKFSKSNNHRDLKNEKNY